MYLLLDTHAFLWYISGDKQLPKKVIEMINNKTNRCYVNIVSIWEIVIKLTLDKLEIKGGFKTIEDFLNNNDFEILSVDFNDTKTLLSIPKIHQDPFDRLIIAQAQTGDLTVVTKDVEFKKYNIKVLW